ncbi:5-formyltetrahydrofolate cyclo-ligase [Cyclobacterium sp. 1_MG-2023]|uniref:5-formyltetrahydrofolate cyclo-ligase n=1 Tax=Cyclobacterium sp. 1_MG-2023 TaxID=3062681 RepID=UPI0026E2666B|nr:5-formyltetrahydrofolate cyclo-ligase [Cyclobacterium sp. 1_MG-2023]MDO6439791.1 5-formyltetrahydrofolate cyclo-ligase [Cyclobacterium sp. 1_MG-2023]
MVTKEVLRQQLRNNRLALGVEEREVFSRKITTNCLSFLKEFPEIKHIHLFLPIKKLLEVNTVPLLQSLFHLNYHVYSSITVHNTRKMATVKLTPETVFENDKLGIPVPKDPVLLEDPKPVELVFVPLLGIDSRGNRIGYGLGFYDKFFGELSDGVMKVGLSFNAPLSEEIPHEPHDVPLDGCIHPEGITLFENY